MDERVALGRWGERLAERHLREHGYRVLQRNLRLRVAELDLVAMDGRCLCFIEVRTRSSDRFGRAEESIDARKRRRLIAGARAALATRRWPRHTHVRFDVVVVDAGSEPPLLRLIRDAFYADSV
jgi:putative endonuclease